MGEPRSYLGKIAIQKARMQQQEEAFEALLDSLKQPIPPPQMPYEQQSQQGHTNGLLRMQSHPPHMMAVSQGQQQHVAQSVPSSFNNSWPNRRHSEEYIGPMRQYNMEPSLSSSRIASWVSPASSPLLNNRRRLSVDSVRGAEQQALRRYGIVKSPQLQRRQREITPTTKSMPYNTQGSLHSSIHSFHASRGSLASLSEQNLQDKEENLSCSYESPGRLIHQNSMDSISDSANNNMIPEDEFNVALQNNVFPSLKSSSSHSSQSTYVEGCDTLVEQQQLERDMAGLSDVLINWNNLGNNNNFQKSDNNENDEGNVENSKNRNISQHPMNYEDMQKGDISTDPLFQQLLHEVHSGM